MSFFTGPHFEMPSFRKYCFCKSSVYLPYCKASISKIISTLGVVCFVILDNLSIIFGLKELNINVIVYPLLDLWLESQSLNKKHRKSGDGGVFPDKRRKPVTVTDILSITCCCAVKNKNSFYW